MEPNEDLIEELYENFLYSGDLKHFFECLELSCSNTLVARTAISLIKKHFQDDAEGNAHIFKSQKGLSEFEFQKLEYALKRQAGISENKIWQYFSETYGGTPESYKVKFARKVK